MNKPLNFLTITAVYLTCAHSSSADSFTKEERTLIRKGMTMEMYKPDEHSRHSIVHITAATDPKTGKAINVNKSQAVVCFVFGIEDAKPARDEGKSMADCHYTPQQAHEFLFAQGWDKYHDRFFTRCYVQEGEAAYEQASKSGQKPADNASTS